MALVKGCTIETLYFLLDELGVDTNMLRKEKATFQELEKIYYMPILTGSLQS
jgi:hypothetical protein